MARDYTYDTKYESSPEQKKRRAKRNHDRRKAIREGRAKKGDGKDVHHVNNDLLGSIKVISRSKNRSMK